MYRKKQRDFSCFLSGKPHARALIIGSPEHPKISGFVNFYATQKGVIVFTQISGLPNPTGKCTTPVFAFHIHAGNRCVGKAQDVFADTLGHYNPNECPHPFHSGDMPPLFGNNGYAFSAFLTDRFSVEEIICKTVIIHSLPDDFTTQPSGNAGKKRCGLQTNGKITGYSTVQEEKN